MFLKSEILKLKRILKTIRLNIISKVCIIFIAAFAILSCTGNKVYDKYAHTPVSGWEKNDTLKFNIPPIAERKLYSSELGLRINGDYPFMGLTLIIEQTVFPSRETHIDTLNCSLHDTHGNSNGTGLSYYQYNFPITNIMLNKGDSLEIKIRHDMKREILPGISDIGFMLNKHE